MNRQYGKLAHTGGSAAPTRPMLPAFWIANIRNGTLVCRPVLVVAAPGTSNGVADCKSRSSMFPRLTASTAPSTSETADSPLVLVAIPARNEAHSIGWVVERIGELTVPGYELLAVVFDDASTDATAEQARRAGARVVSSEHPVGLGAFFRAAVHEALEHGAAILVNIDGDGQFDPVELPMLVEPITAGRAEFVAGDRFAGRSGRPANMSLVKHLGNRWMASLVRGITGLDICDVSSGFRAYSREAMLRINLHSRFTYTQEAFLDLAVKGVRIEQVPVTVQYFAGRKSRVAGSIPRYALNTFIVIFRSVRDYRPLRTFGIAAIALVLPGLACSGFVAWHYLYTGSFSPFVFLALIGAYLVTLALVTALVGLASDMLAPLRRNQETLIYLSRRLVYERRAQDDGPTR